MLDLALPAIQEAASLTFMPGTMMYLAAGILLGLMVGVFPGLGGIAGLSLVLPFIYGLDAASGLALMIGLVAVIPTSDTFASVLLGIPGSAASQATVIDGFPLSKKGHAARALSAAFVSSLFGGLIGAFVLTFLILIARPLILAFGIPELLFLTILGFSMVGVLAGNSLLKGIVTVCLGMLVGAIGEAPAEGSIRMSYDSWYLQDGLELVIIGLGIFAIPEIITLLRHDRPIAKDAKIGAGWMDGIRDWWLNKWLSIRCAIIGVIVGVIPGLGGAVVDWISYGHTVQTTKDRSEFGKGDIRGVIGPESSNNAKEGGGLVPTLLFGIPGSGSMAVFLAGMVLLGIDAGPQMIKNNLPLTYSIVWSLALANVIGAGLSILLASQIAKLTTIRFTLVAPFLLTLISFTAFQSEQTLWDLVAIVVIGILGLYMKRFDWSRPAFLIGFVLSDQAEVYTYQVIQIVAVRAEIGGYGTALSYMFSPTGLTILAVTAVSVWFGSRTSIGDISDNGPPPSYRRRPALIFASFIAFAITWMLVDTLSIENLTDKVFPLVISVIAISAMAILLVKMWMLAPTTTDSLVSDEEQVSKDPADHGIYGTLSWFLLILIITALAGYFIALITFFVMFMRYRAGVSWRKTGVLTISAVAFILGLADILNRDFPPGLLQGLFDLPWPFR
jgi:TctA family transporter